MRLLVDGSSTNRRRRAVGLVVCAGAVLLIGGSRVGVPLRNGAAPEIASRAFVITDPETLEPFTFDRTIASITRGLSADWLGRLASRNRDARRQRQLATPLARFIQARSDGDWLVAGSREWSYIRPIALVNRFDLAAPYYRHCGEYRLIFSHRGEGAPKTHIAIETVLPNPDPAKGKRGCADVARFWRDLAETEPADVRREQLERFFFTGLRRLAPAFARQTFETSGRIRTSEIGIGLPKFRQFSIETDCTTPRPCRSQLVQMPLDNMPHAALFDSTRTSALGAPFRQDFLRQVVSLSAPDVNRISMEIDSVYSTRDVEEITPVFNYQLPFRKSLRAPAGQRFRDQIAAELRKVGSKLTPEDIIERAETQNCAGCHAKHGPLGDGVVFPKAFDTGEHLADGSLGESARMSPALEQVFVPYRIHLLQDYLQGLEETRSPVPRLETSFDGRIER